MKYILNRMPEYSKESIVKEIKRIDSELGKEILTQKDVIENGSIGSRDIIKKFFGSFENALKEAGLAHKFSGRGATYKRTHHLGKDEIIKELKRISNKLDTKTLRREDINNNSDLISASTLNAKFGSMEEGLHAAGLKKSKTGVRYTDELCFENILKVWTKLGRQPQYKDMNTDISDVGGKAYMVRWGTWLKALEAFIERINNESFDYKDKNDVQKVENENEKTKKKISPEDRREIRLGLRYKILLRDNFKCVYCGRNPAVDPKVELHIDHIIPFSKGGKTIEDNLQTLCKECNLGKSNRI